MGKNYLGVNVLEAAQERIAYAFSRFPRVYISFSGGKDSGVMLHLCAQEARRQGRRMGMLFMDLEGQYRMTIDYMHQMLDLYGDVLDNYWVALPLNLRNAVSQFEPQWCCWEPDREEDWVRPRPERAISDQAFFPFYRYRMEFEEFVPAFGEWYSQGEPTCCFVGIRSGESLNRWRTVASQTKRTLEGKRWTTWIGGNLFNAYPVYDWQTADIWRYYGKTKLPYNRLYDYMHRAGLTIHQQRICQPYGDDQRKGLWLFHIIEPETWARVVARVNGANQGALYARETGNILGVNKISKPAHLSWQQFAEHLLAGMPPRSAEHYRNKIAVFLRWYEARGYYRGIIPDEGSITDKRNPSWQRICKALLRNDYWCKGLSFTQTKPDNYQKYLDLMKRRRQSWGL
jgi:predicted phosphoadenosine phosphosulfate sulfurtransferase